jgi:hypothetical protein
VELISPAEAERLAPFLRAGAAQATWYNATDLYLERVVTDQGEIRTPLVIDAAGGLDAYRRRDDRNPRADRARARRERVRATRAGAGCCSAATSRTHSRLT